MSKLFIHAPNVHQGGGAILLLELLRKAAAKDIAATIDSRMELPPDLSFIKTIKRVKPTIWHRLMAEIGLMKAVNPDDLVLCFGNLPPMFKLVCSTSVFLQNRYLVDPDAPMSELVLRDRIRIIVERVWLKTLYKNASQYFVQTMSMQGLLKKSLGINAKITAFVSNDFNGVELPKIEASEYKFDFVYVASGEAHKNHRTLVAAWKILAEQGLFPSLALTLSSENNIELVDFIEKEQSAFGLHIDNIGVVSHKELLSIYRQTRALLYPSEFESYGLPLVEARLLGLSVLASESDYVRDVIDPNETFDPNSPLSIARAVKRFLYKSQPPPIPGGPADFLDSLRSRIVD